MRLINSETIITSEHHSLFYYHSKTCNGRRFAVKVKVNNKGLKEYQSYCPSCNLHTGVYRRLEKSEKAFGNLSEAFFKQNRVIKNILEASLRVYRTMRAPA